MIGPLNPAYDAYAHFQEDEQLAQLLQGDESEIVARQIASAEATRDDAILARLLELSFQALIVASLRTLYQFPVLRNTAPWFVNTGSRDHFNREHVSGP